MKYHINYILPQLDINDVKLIKQLFIFLKRHNALEFYIKNIRKESRNLLSFYRMACYRCGLSLISGAFFFMDTQEGYAFWHSLDIKWRRKCHYLGVEK